MRHPLRPRPAPQELAAVWAGDGAHGALVLTRATPPGASRVDTRSRSAVGALPALLLEPVDGCRQDGLRPGALGQPG